jgi:hypothetical protein
MNVIHAKLCRALSAVLLLAVVGCGEGKVCTLELALITVEVRAPADLSIARVSADNRALETCEADGGGTGPRTGPGTYRCGEQAGGAYEFVVEAVDGRRWTQTVEVDHDGCHIVDYDRVVFDLTTTEADED